MLDDIRFTISATAKKALLSPEFTHFRIAGGRITGTDGLMTLSSAIGLDLDVRPNAAKFLAAVRACEGTISLHVTGAGKLAVRAGTFRAYVDCLPDDSAPVGQPEGETVELSEGFFEGVRHLSPLMGIDASRPWAMGVKAAGPSLYATNNVMVGQYWHGADFPHDVVIPARAVDELLRIGDPPVRVQVCPGSVTFWFSEERWLKTNLLEATGWPVELLEEKMNEAPRDGLEPLPENFAQEVARLKPFLASEDPAVYLTPTSMSTAREDGAGAAVDMAFTGAPELQAYGYRQLEILARVATAVNWRSHPKPCTFTHQGDPRLRGLIIGRRL